MATELKQWIAINCTSINRTAFQWLLLESEIIIFSEINQQTGYSKGSIFIKFETGEKIVIIDDVLTGGTMKAVIEGVRKTEQSYKTLSSL